MENSHLMVITQTQHCIKGMHETLTPTQKLQLRTRFVNELTKRYQEGDCMPSQKEFETDINSVYTNESFEKMETCLNSNKLNAHSMGIINLLWFEELLDFIYELCNEGNLEINLNLDIDLII